MELQQYINKKKEIQDILLNFLDNRNDIIFDDLTSVLERHEITQNFDELKEFLNMLLIISNYHHRTPIFFPYIKQIILYFKNEIHQIFSNVEIFHFFKRNKNILLILFKEQILKFDESIFDIINEMPESKRKKILQFFYPELKPFIDNEMIKTNDTELFEYDAIKIETKRKLGENDSYLGSLIRNDCVEEFISYVNKSNTSLHSTTIKPSIYETNSFLKNRETTLIEYSSYFGSIQIFRYLLINNVSLQPSLWLFAIHSQNAELIH